MENSSVAQYNSSESTDLLAEIPLIQLYSENKAVQVMGQPVHIHVGQIAINNDHRHYLFIHPPAGLNFVLPGGAIRLSFSVAMHPETWDQKESGAVEFLVIENNELVSRTVVNAVANLHHRQWLDIGLELPASASINRTITLATRGLPDNSYRWALWGDPIVHLRIQEELSQSLEDENLQPSLLAGMLSQMAFQLVQVSGLVEKLMSRSPSEEKIPDKSKKFPDGPYEQLLPEAHYAPWLEDPSFLHAYQMIQGYTFVHKYKCYEIWSLVQQTAKLEGALIEVGVWRGGTAGLIARQSQLCNIKRSHLLM